MKTAAIVFLCVSVGCSTIALSISAALVENDLHSISMDVHETASVTQERVKKLDATLDKVNRMVDSANTALKSANSAIKTHEQMARKLDTALNDPEKGVGATLRLVNGFIIQSEETSKAFGDVVREEHESLAVSNQKIAETTEKAGKLVDSINAQVNSEDVAQTRKNVREITDAVNKALHPPKQTKMQRFLGFFVRILVGGAIQGATQGAVQ